ncbi:MAG TPA: hypothetical protein VF843_16655 [Streptosporangiaceae bacterium]
MTPHPMVLAGVALIAVATLAGAWISARTARMPDAAMKIAACLLFAVVLADLLPDIWRDLPGSGLPWWAAAAAAAAGFTGAGALARIGCACDPEPGPTAASQGTGWGAAAALAVHRALEGAAVTLAGSPAVIAALVAHAAAEGFAIAALLRASRRRLVPLLFVACVSPAAGAFVIASLPIPAGVSVVLTGLVAGVLTRTAVTAWLAARPARGGLVPMNPVTSFTRNSRT